MNADFYNALDLLEKEKGIPKDYMIEKIELALANACRKEVGQTTVIRVQIDPVKQDMRVYQQRTVVPDGEVNDPKCEISLSEAKSLSRRHKLGGVVETELKTKNFRRLSAQAGKQMIIQAIRDAERERQTREYENKKEEIITAIVDKVDTTTGNLILDTGTGYATLMKADQIPGETHEVGDRIKVFISEVNSGETRGPLVTLSRVHPNFVKRLFELEIPEIQDGTVIINYPVSPRNQLKIQKDFTLTLAEGANIHGDCKSPVLHFCQDGGKGFIPDDILQSLNAGSRHDIFCMLLIDASAGKVEHGVFIQLADGGTVVTYHIFLGAQNHGNGFVFHIFA